MSRYDRERRGKNHKPLSTPEEHRQFILDNWDHFAALAWRAFQDCGRGFINIWVDRVHEANLEPGVSAPGCIAYLPTKSLAEHGVAWPVPEMPQLMEKYDPERQIVFLFHRQLGGRESRSVYRVESLPMPKDTVYLGDVGQVRVRL